MWSDHDFPAAAGERRQGYTQSRRPTRPGLQARSAAIEDGHPKRGDAYLCNLTYRSSHRARAGGAGEKGESTLLSAHVAAHLDSIGTPAVPL